MAAPLVAPEDLRIYMQHSTVVREAAQLAVRVAEGWLRSATSLTAWPEPVPDDLFAWCIELAAIAYTNPVSRSTRTVGADTEGWAVARKSEILAEARSSGYGAAQPQHSFPPLSLAYDPVIRS